MLRWAGGMVESTALSPKDVVITRTVAKFGNTSYQIAAISSVSAQHRESVNWNFVSTGFLLIIAALVIGYFEWASWTQVGIAGGIIVVITIILSSAFPIRTAADLPVQMAIKSSLSNLKTAKELCLDVLSSPLARRRGDRMSQCKFRYRHKADIQVPSGNVRFWG
jgi:hypothetical protein